ncbi:LuxR C-terminal-related transcriptional regulator [Saccharopolyspora griseoalba]|uniref:LuxR C-terminal-related transcriptional regulator n=1 Tax=Saccharopolyspora griseoalba TaxID=1431848 RepID=A0ABW2LTD9_9PSEU
MPTPALLRPRDEDAVGAELRTVRSSLGVGLTFGGRVTGDTLHISELQGARTGGLRGLEVPAGFGLGGKVVAELWPRLITDYASARTITHQFDREVLSEGIRSVVAVPVIASGRPRAVLYAAVRGHAPLGARAVEVMTSAAKRLTTEFRIQDEVDRRLRLMGGAQEQPVHDAAAAEELRAAYGELRDIAASTTDPGLRSRLRGLCERLQGRAGEPPVALTDRETDVLAQIALGCSNVEAAERLGLKPETVKSYLRNAMQKLDARTRHQAVVNARRHGALP